MPQFRMKVRRVTEEQLEFTIEADSDVHAHQLMELQSEVANCPVVSSETRVSVIECHRFFNKQETGRQIDR